MTTHNTHRYPTHDAAIQHIAHLEEHIAEIQRLALTLARRLDDAEGDRLRLRQLEHELAVLQQRWRSVPS